MSRALDPAAGERINLALLALHVAIAVTQYFVLPLLLLPLDFAWALLLIPLAAMNNPLWSLIHETVHDTFHRQARINRFAGRLLGVLYGAPWRVLRVGHLLHHGLNRTELDRQEVYEPEEGSRLSAATGYYYQLLGGLYLNQVLSAIAFYFPLPALLVARKRLLDPESYNGHAAAALLRPKHVWEIRVDGLLILAVFGASIWAYGSQAWLLLLILAARGFAISFLDYIYHYGSPIDDKQHAYNLTLPAVVQRVLLNFNLHAVHHRFPRLPWYRLPEAFARDGHDFAGGYLVYALRQLRGPIPRSQLG